MRIAPAHPRRIRWLALTLGGVVALAAANTPSRATADPPGPEQVHDWAFAIGNRTLTGTADAVGERYARFDLVVVDGEEATAAKVAAMRSRGALALAYLSVGTIERWRGWYPQLKRYRLGAWRDWEDEWFADTARAGLRREIAGEIAPTLLAKGFDGLFLDNTDMVEVPRHRAQRAGMGRLISRLDQVVGPDRLLFTQNGHRGMARGYPGQGVPPLAPSFEGWNREDASWTWDFEDRRYRPVGARGREAATAELEGMRGLGLLTTATDYVDLEDASSAAECASEARAREAGALPYVANIGLTREAVFANPPDCP